MPAPRRAILGLAAAAGAAVAVERVVLGRMRRRVDAVTDPLLRLPADVVHRRVPTHDGGSLHLVERGEGRPLVLLHGITLAAPIWSPQLHQLAGSPGVPGFRVFAVDLRGHGQSEAGGDGYGLDLVAHDLATLLDELDLRDAVVVGHSMGGMSIMKFCADHPDVLSERVTALGFVATAAAPPVHPFLLARAEVLGARMIDRLDAGRPLPSYRFSGGDVSLVLCRLAFGKRPSSAAVEQVRACVEAMDPGAMQRSGVGLLAHDAREALPDVKVPAIVVVGSRDLLTPVASSRAIADLLPDAELHVLPGAGHQLMQERPAELGALLRDLAARTAPARTGWGRTATGP